MGRDEVRVLVVEDDRHIRDLLSEALVFEGYAVRVAANGRLGLAIVAGWRPDLIILDLMMPEMNGWEFRAQQLARPELRDVPVIVLSAVHETEARRAQLDGMTFVRKPFELDTMLELVERLLRPSRSRRRQPAGSAD